MCTSASKFCVVLLNVNLNIKMLYRKSVCKLQIDMNCSLHCLLSTFCVIYPNFLVYVSVLHIRRPWARRNISDRSEACAPQPRMYLCLLCSSSRPLILFEYYLALQIPINTNCFQLKIK